MSRYIEGLLGGPPQTPLTPNRGGSKRPGAATVLTSLGGS